MSVSTNSTVAKHVQATQRPLSEMGRPVMAKADLRMSEIRDFRAGIGACVDRARRAMGWNIDELAAACGGDRDASQVGRWCRGTERPQFDVLLGIEGYGDELLIELASFCGARISRRVEFPERRRA